MADLSRRGFLGSLVAGSGAVALSGREARATEVPRDPTTTSPVRVTVNGTEHAFDVGPDELTLDLLRERIGLTGSKRACGHGACGACTVLVDGVPHNSCLLPATAVHAAEITTIEAIGAPTLHPVQRAFMARDALQCGFCTPGFVVEASAFVDAWRAEHGPVRPSRDQVADALEGHLCRCGAYQDIHAAVMDACEGRFDTEGASGPRIDALAKVTGAAVYTVDVKRPNQLEAAVRRSAVAHGVVTRIDLGPAKGMPGVKAVVPYVKAGGRLRYVGQPVAAVAAVDLHTALEAAEAIRVEVDVLPAVIGAEQARAAGAPAVYASAKVVKTEGATAAEGAVMPGSLEGNLRGPVQLPFANEKAAHRRLAEASAGGTVVRGTYTAQTQCHTTLEPHAAVAEWTGDSLEIWVSTQSCADLSHDLAELYELKHEQVRVRCDFVGGGFGAKAGLHMESRVAADLAREAKAPVRYVTPRDVEIAVAGLRPGARVEMELGTMPDGELAGMVGQAFSDTGVSVGNLVAGLGRLIYPSKYKDLADYEVISHTPPGLPFRGPGGPQALFAIESAMDKLAVARGMDPIDLRRGFDENPGRLRLYDQAQGLDLWKGRHDRGGGRFLRGVGMASSCWLPMVQRDSFVQVGVGPDGIVASSACQDMGNGSKTVVARAVAEVFGIDPHEVEVRFGDSRLPRGPMSAGSRTATSMSPTARAAAVEARDYLLEVAERTMGLQAPRPGRGGVDHAGGSVPWSEVLAAASPFTTVQRRPRDPDGYFLPFAVGDLRFFRQVPAGVTVVEVVVDTHTGVVRVPRAWSGISVGKILVPEMATTQVHGGILQGISYALYEDRVLDPSTGVTLSNGLETYRILGIGDVPEMEVHFDEGGFDGIVSGGIGLSELCTVGVPAALANAVFHATGVQPERLPLTPEQLLGGRS